MKSPTWTYALLMTLVLLALFAANLTFGAVRIPLRQVVEILSGGEAERASWGFIVLQSRLPQAVTALLCGASLAASGLMLQTYFGNPLAGPSILGISSGASLGVALVVLVTGGVMGSATMGNGNLHLTGYLAIVAAAFVGAMGIIALLLMVTRYVQNRPVLLIVGIMMGYLTSSVVSLCNFFATAENVHTYVHWGMGSFSNVNLSQLPFFASVCLAGLGLGLSLVKPLNALLLGEHYAMNLGVNIARVRQTILLATGLLTAVTTAFCGPVAFIGLAVPHMAKLLLRNTDHRVLLPTTLLMGACIALLCNLICTLPSGFIMPLNAVTPLFGAPVIIYILIKRPL